MPQIGARLVVIGAPLAIADKQFSPSADAAALEEVLHSFVCSVKGLAA